MKSNEQAMTLGSLFDGIGGFPYAASFYGIAPVWASEILPQAVSVTMRHFPQMRHVGDITKLDGAKLPPVDIITFGSPCQDLSTAGRRAGLSGERSGLFTEAMRIIFEMREATSGQYPRYALWENVPGAMSSGKPAGSDFRAVLEAFTKTKIPMPDSGKWANAGMVRSDGADLAWRVLNAQYHGVPQRRRRIFLICDFRGCSAGEILFVEKGLRGHFAPGGQAWQDAAADVERGIGRAMQRVEGRMKNEGQGQRQIAFSCNQRDEVRDLHDVSAALCASPSVKQQTFLAKPAECLNPWDTQQSRVFPEESASPTLAGADGGGGRNPAGLVFCSASSQSHAGITEELAGTLTCQHEQPFICEPELARTLTARGDSSACADRGQNVVAVQRQDDGVGINGDIAGTLDASYYKGTGERNGKEREVVLCRASGQSNAEQLENLSATLNCGAEQPIVAYDGTSAHRTAAPPAITMRMREGKPGGGKGPLFQEEKSAALATRGDQYLFAPAVSVHQNGSGELSVSETAKSLTTLSTGSCRNAPLVAQTPAILCAATGQANAELAIDLCPTITEAAGTSGNNKPYIVQPCAYALQGNMLGRQPHNGPAGSGVSKDLSFTLTATDTPAIASAIPIHDKATRCEGGGPTRSGDGCGNGLGVGKPGAPAPTLTSGDHHSVAVIPINTQTATRHAALGEGTGFGVGNESSPAFTLQQAHCHAVAAVDCRNYKEVGDVSGALQAKDKPGYSLNYQNPVRAGYIVRRLTPTECERLQGFPDGWTKFGHDGKEISDTKRYQMLGNSVAVPCVAFIMSGVSAQLLQIRREAA